MYEEGQKCLVATNVKKRDLILNVKYSKFVFFASPKQEVKCMLQ